MPLLYNEFHNHHYSPPHRRMTDILRDGVGGDKPKRYVFDGDLTNERILQLGLKYGLIKNLASGPDDVVANLLVRDNELGSLLGLIVSQNKKHKAFSLTGKLDHENYIAGKPYTNPQKYLEAIKKELAKGSQIRPLTTTKELIECLGSKLKINGPVDTKTRKRYQKQFVRQSKKD